MNNEQRTNGRGRVTRLTSHPLTKCLLLFMPKNSDPARRAKSRTESNPLELLDGRRRAANPPPAQAAYKLKPAAEYLGGFSTKIQQNTGNLVEIHSTKFSKEISLNENEKRKPFPSPKFGVRSRLCPPTEPLPITHPRLSYAGRVLAPIFNPSDQQTKPEGTEPT